MDNNLPIVLTLRVESTNYSTCRYALEALLKKMNQNRAPEPGEVLEDNYWKLTVVNNQNLMSESP